MKKLISQPKNDHGCHGTWLAVSPLSDDVRGIVVEASACSTCVGDELMWVDAFLGKVVVLPESFSGGWDEAAEVLPIESFSMAEETRVLPGQLRLVPVVLIP